MDNPQCQSLQENTKKMKSFVNILTQTLRKDTFVLSLTLGPVLKPPHVSDVKYSVYVMANVPTLLGRGLSER